MKDDAVLDFSFGWLFPPNMRIAGYIAIAIGIPSLFESWPIALVIMFAGAWMAFRSSGVQVRPSSQEYREYTRYLLKRGKWISYQAYTDMALIRGKEGYRAYSRGMVELSDSEVVHDIYLLSPDHRKRLILTRIKNSREAEQKGRGLAEQLGLKWTVYSPKVSAKTEALRRKRRR